MTYKGNSWKTKILQERKKLENERQKELKKADKQEKHHCYDCKHAYLMQSDKLDPIVCICNITQEREVARMFVCNNGNFESNSGETKVIHEMIKATNI